MDNKIQINGVRLDKQVHQKLKAEALTEGRSMTAQISFIILNRYYRAIIPKQKKNARS